MKILDDINRLNLVNQKTEEMPNYDLKKRETSIKIYLNLTGNLIILGVVDNNYIHWASITKTNEIEVNESIFNYISNVKYDIVSSEYKALESVNIRYEELKKWYCSSLTRADENNMAWRTPFGHYYGVDQVKNNGLYFAKDVNCFLASLQKLCHYRESNGNYIIVLRGYYDILSGDKGDYAYYELVKPLIGILEQENYLRVSENDEIRKLYVECMNQCSRLYNQYMTVVR